MKVRLLIVILLFACSLVMYSQEYSYTHYDSKDGLAGSTVYNVTQDKEGFLWFVTETGVSRFDGTHFKNFTREDGLPDNDVIQVFADSKGRVWMAPFKKTVCYYFNGKIYNSKNDPILKKLQFHDNIYRFTEDRAGNILMQEKNRLHLVPAKGEVVSIATNGKSELGYISLIAGRREGGFWILENDSIFILNNNRFAFWRGIDLGYKNIINDVTFCDETLVWRSAFEEMKGISMRGDKKYIFPNVPCGSLINTVAPDNRLLAICSMDGAYVFNKADPGQLQHYLPGLLVSNMFEDREGNWWFSTLGKGVYRLNSAFVMNLSNILKKVPLNPFPLEFRNQEWSIMTHDLEVIKKYSFENEREKDLPYFGWFNSSPIFSAISLPGNKFLIGTGRRLLKVTNDFSLIIIKKDISVKAFCLHNATILVSTPENVIALDRGNFTILDTIWHERATCVFSNNDSVYIGTTNGLYLLPPGKKAQYLGERESLFQERITAVREDANHICWVATAGEGLIACRHGKVVKHFTWRDGLTSNNCRNLFLENGQLWVGTDKGLNKVNVLQPGLPIQKYTISDGLSSDIIDAVYVYDKKVFVGTPQGITFFDEDKISSRSRCDLRFTDITIDGKTFYPADAPVSIPHKKNNLQFNYVGISFKSAGDIRYRYRLLGLDSNWRETRETFLSYPTLPSGDYQLQLQAINKFDVSSTIITAPFTIQKLLYEKNWFRLLMGLLFLSVTGLLVWLIVQLVKRRERQKTDFIKRISELEQLSRKAQMNPHFIFNSLNSIQQYVMDADVAGANKFISGFSRLIRQTLDFSSKQEISLDEELDYLSNYLELEKTRLEDAFTWSVIIDKEVEPSEYHIPPMILQPFVENSVRHGLRFRKDREGKVTIQIKKENDYLVCIIEDNGIGRKAAMKHKSVSPINYQSKGLSLTADRISMFNKESLQKITMHIDDLEDNFHNPLGTRVTISFPVF